MSFIGGFTVYFHRYCSQSVQPSTKAQNNSQKELEPLKLPGKLGTYTGNVLYPSDDSAVWDVNGECTCTHVRYLEEYTFLLLMVNE